LLCPINAGLFPLMFSKFISLRISSSIGRAFSVTFTTAVIGPKQLTAV